MVTLPDCCVVLSGTGTTRARDARELAMELILRIGRRTAADITVVLDVEVEAIGKMSEGAVEEDELEELLVGGTMSFSGIRPGRFGGMIALICDLWELRRLKGLRKSGESEKGAALGARK